MPQRKRTRTMNVNSKPTLEMTGEVSSLTKPEKQKKIQCFLRDFDVKVETMKVNMEQQCSNIIHQIEQKFYYELAQLTKGVREMTFTDFLKCGGTIEAAEDHLIYLGSKNENDIVHSSKMYSTKSKRARAHRFETISEEDGSTFTVPRTMSRVQKFNAMTPLAENKFQTPAGSRTLAATGWDTPLITPKFDPRLPLTDAQKRPAQPGEIVMSIRGSPLRNPRAGGGIQKRGRTLTVGVDANTAVDEIEIPDSFSKTEITALMKTLQGLLENAKDD